MDIQNKINEVVQNLSASERVQGRHLKASIEPKINEVSEWGKYLDALARLLTGEKDTCVAVCYDNEEKKLLVSSNKEKLEHTEKYLAILSEFINSTQQSSQKLLELTVEKVCLKLKNESARRRAKSIQSSNNDNGLNEFKKIVEVYNEDNDQFGKLKEAIDSLFVKIIKLKKDGEDTKANKLWDYLVPFADINIIVRVITSESQSEVLDQGIIEAIRNKNVDLIEGSEKVHAEMKMVDRLRKTENSHYIGLTKLNCVPCKLAIDILIEEEYKLEACGTHGSTYLGWIAPNIFEKEEWKLGEKFFNRLEEIKNNEEKYTKLRESTSETPSESIDIMSWLEGLQVSLNLSKSDAQNWQNIHPNFNEELIQSWTNLNFTYTQTQDWINIGLKPTDYSLAKFLKTKKNLTPEQTLNHYSLESLKTEFEQSQIQTLQVQSTTPNWPNN